MNQQSSEVLDMNNKRLALLLFGLSYTKYKHWEAGDVLIDFRLSIDNYKKYIYLKLR